MKWTHIEWAEGFISKRSGYLWFNFISIHLPFMLYSLWKLSCRDCTVCNKKSAFLKIIDQALLFRIAGLAFLNIIWQSEWCVDRKLLFTLWAHCLWEKGSVAFEQLLRCRQAYYFSQFQDFKPQHLTIQHIPAQPDLCYETPLQSEDS